MCYFTAVSICNLGQQLTATSGAQVGVWQAVLGYTLASSCGLLWCIEGVVNNALHGDTYSGLLRNPKVGTRLETACTMLKSRTE